MNWAHTYQKLHSRKIVCVHSYCWHQIVSPHVEHVMCNLQQRPELHRPRGGRYRRINTWEGPHLGERALICHKFGRPARI